MASITYPTISYPFGPTDIFNIANQTASQTFTIANDVTILNTILPLTFSTAAITITASASLAAGAELFILAAASGTTSTITLSGNIKSGTIAPTTGTTASIGFIYDGSNFYPQGTVVIH
jgi:hypothetical protein